MTRKKYSVAIVGATGLIGRKFLSTLEKRNFPASDLYLFASEKSEGIRLNAFSRTFTVHAIKTQEIKDFDIAFFSAGKDVALTFAPIFAQKGVTVIDNSSAFRSCPSVPLVIPEINVDAAIKTNSKIISNPNCSTVQAILPLANLYKKYGLKRLIISTYQAVSGTGQNGINALTNLSVGKKSNLFPLNLTKSVLCKIGSPTENGYTEEELKAESETRKILNSPVLVSATCVRVPIENCHGVSVEAEFEEEITQKEAEDIIDKTNGVSVKNLPNSVYADGKDEVFVGRIRKSTAFKNGISYFCVADNTLKGAALNAVQIAENLILNGKI